MEINFFKNKILKSWIKLTDMEKNVIQYLFDNKVTLPIKELSIETGASISTISNLCKKIGFEGYKEFNYEQRRSIQNDLDIKSESNVVEKIFNDYKTQINLYRNFNLDLIVPWKFEVLVICLMSLIF